MDISYLLVLQELRGKLGEAVSEGMSLLTKFSISYWPLAVLLLVYWVWDREAGRRMLGGMAVGFFFNCLLKAIFCVYRPWIRDARVEPWGDSKVAATGYSFPSGHSTMATSQFGGIGIWLRRRRRWISVVCFALIALTMFSRNYLGVHTPQDVLVGSGATFLAMFLVCKLEDWADQDLRRDWIVLIAGLVVCAAAALFFLYKSYPMDYTAEGKLLVDPDSMKADTFIGLGTLFMYITCRFIERRFFYFDTELTKGDRLIIGLIAIIPGYFLQTDLVSSLQNVHPYLYKFFSFSSPLLYGMIVVPLFMHIYARFRKV